MLWDSTSTGAVAPGLCSSGQPQQSFQSPGNPTQLGFQNTGLPEVRAEGLRGGWTPTAHPGSLGNAAPRSAHVLVCQGLQLIPAQQREELFEGQVLKCVFSQQAAGTSSLVQPLTRLSLPRAVIVFSVTVWYHSQPLMDCKADKHTQLHRLCLLESAVQLQ